MKAIILAAGKGKRMQSDMQKVVHPILGKPIVQYIVEAAKDAGFGDITVIIGPDGAEIKQELETTHPNLHYATQEERLGTGHAVQCGMERVKADDDVLILCGDMPLVTGEFIRELMDYRAENPADAVVSAVFNPLAQDFGKVFDESGNFIEIVEARDITPSHSQTDWANIGIYLFKGEALLHGLSQLKNNNSQNEYYLTDVPKILREAGRPVRVFHTKTEVSVFTGINTQVQLAEAAGHMRDRINTRHMLEGVRMFDPSTVFIDDAVKLARGVVIYPNTILEGACEIAENAILGPGTHMKDTIVGAGAAVRHSVTASAKIGAGTEVGPFAYLRPGANIGEKCRIGNFVEVKNANLGNGTKMAHLAYIGDADVGENVNYSCGAITANYDGKNKYRTVIADNAFIGSNANLVAPLTVGESGFVAAGSTITDNVPPCALGIARGRQHVKENWNAKN